MGPINGEEWQERCNVLTLKMEEGGHETRNVGGHIPEAGKGKNSSLRSSRKECSPANTLILPGASSFGLLTYRTVRQYI